MKKEIEVFGMGRMPNEIQRKVILDVNFVWKDTKDARKLRMLEASGCTFNFNCIVLDVCQVKIGDFTLFGPAVQIYTATHPMNAELCRKQEFGKPVEIGSDVWVGGGAIICPGVSIGSKPSSEPGAL